MHLAAGEWQQAVDAFTELLDDGPTDAVRPELLRALAEGYCRLEQGAEGVRAASEAAELFRRQGRHADAAWATYWEASSLHELEQGDGARELLLRVLDEIAQGLTVDSELRLRILIALATIDSRDDQPERALGYLEQARAMVGLLDDRRRATFLFSLAMSYHELGDLEAALTTGSQSLTHFRAADAEREVASIENELALVFLALGQVDRAAEHVAEARVGFERLGSDRSLAHVIDTEARIDLARGAGDAAADSGASRRAGWPTRPATARRRSVPRSRWRRRAGRRATSMPRPRSSTTPRASPGRRVVGVSSRPCSANGPRSRPSRATCEAPSTCRRRRSAPAGTWRPRRRVAAGGDEEAAVENPEV